MSWFKKKKEGERKSVKVSELPELPELPKLPGDSEPFKMPEMSPGLSRDSESFRLPELPELRKSEEHSFSNRRVPPAPHGLPSFPTSKVGEGMGREMVKHAINHSKEEETIKPIFNRERRTIEVGEGHEGFGESFFRVKKTGPLFVKIEKFKEAAEHLEEIKSKISEIDEMLRKIKDMKSKEDEELSEWEREVQIIKSRIESIDNAVFSKVD